MTDTRSLTIELPAELVRLVEEDVATGGYESASAVVREALETRHVGFALSDETLRREVLPVLDACERDSSRLLTSDEVFARLEARHQRELEARGNGG